jgi:hypothetical protein
MKQLFLACAIACLGSVTWAMDCQTDLSLQKAGFDVSTTGFREAYAKIQRLMGSEQNYLEALKGGTIRSSVSGKMVTVVPVDDLRTESKVMLGDYVLLFDFKTHAPVEVRWFENGVRYVRYTPSETPCATAMIPWAYNSLY